MFHLKTENFEGFATVPNAFAPHEVDILRNMIDTPGDKVSAVLGDDKITDTQIRDSRVKWLMPVENDLQWVFQRMAAIVGTVNSQYFGMDLTASEGIQLTEYDSVYQGFYGAHTDSIYGSGQARHRKLSVTMQLSDPSEYEGGELALYHQNIKAPFIASTVKGTMTLFRSHIIHEVLPVTKGKRYSFVTWIHGPLFR